MQFHINPRGDVGRCLSKRGNCPFGGEHFDDALSAWAATERTSASLVIAPPLKKRIAKVSPRIRQFLKEIVSELPETSGTEVYPVEDNWGDFAELTEGQLTTEANWILKHGQCLGFASELAKAFGTDKVAVLHSTVTSDEIAWDDENDEPLLNEDGEEYFESYENIIHAYAVDPEGHYWDVDGSHKSHELEISSQEKITEHESSQAEKLYEKLMSNQNRNFSRTLIKPLLQAHLGGK